MSYSVREYIHYQGDDRPGRTFAIYQTKEEAEWVRDHIISCSWCAPAKNRGKGKGFCYKVYETDKPATHKTPYGFQNQGGETHA